MPDEIRLNPEFLADLLKGIVVLKGSALANAGPAAGKKEQPFLAIPYYAWAHRGEGEMAVWIPRK